MKTWIITTEWVGQRLDHFLAQHLEDSRSQINQMIKTNYIRCNNQNVKPSYSLQLHDEIVMQAGFKRPIRIEAIKMKLDIIYEDDWLCIVNKPQGLVVHPSPYTKEPTLLHGLTEYFASQNIQEPVGLVHRIDKDTSGLLVIAKDAKTHAFLAQQLTDKTMQRHYLALVSGRVNQDFTAQEPLGMNPHHQQKRMAYGLEAQTAITHFKVIQHYNQATLLECSLETGRTHQIRVHAAYHNHPLIGDRLYNPQPGLGLGQLLCAYHLEFIHPHTKKQVSFHIEPPASFQQFL